MNSAEVSCVIAKRAVSNRHCPDVEDAAASQRSRVADDSAVGDHQRAAAVVIDAGAGARGVAADSAVSDGQHAAVEDAAAKPSSIAAENAVDNGHCRVALIIDAGTSGAGVAIPDREIRNCNSCTRGDLEHSAEGVAVNCQHVRTGAINCYALVHEQYAAGKCDGAGNSCGINCVAVIRVRERLTQRARTAVIGIGHGDDVRVGRDSAYA